MTTYDQWKTREPTEGEEDADRRQREERDRQECDEAGGMVDPLADDTDEAAQHAADIETGQLIPEPVPFQRGDCAPFLIFAQDNGLDYGMVLLASEGMRKQRDADMNPHERAAYDAMLMTNTDVFCKLGDLTERQERLFGRPCPAILRF